VKTLVFRPLMQKVKALAVLQWASPMKAKGSPQLAQQTVKTRECPLTLPTAKTPASLQTVL
jgi:hypothetical protein